MQAARWSGARMGRISILSLQYRLEYAAFCVVAWIAAALPLETASNVSGRLWRWVAPLFKRHARALKHLRLAYPELTEAERAHIAGEMWETLGRVFAEAFHLDEILDGDRIAYDNLDEMKAAGIEGVAAIGCAAHLGNWEIAAALAGTLGRPAMGIYQRVKNPLVDARVRQMRARLYPGGILPKEPATGLRAIRHVRDGGTLTMLADLRDKTGLPVSFFGIPARSTTFPAVVARTLNAPLIAVQVVRERGVRFRIRGVRVEVPRTADRQADIAQATANLQHLLEQFIRAHPAQWMWAHRRWG
jgi:KDO2-lipid IV(A) lauroyltransferase